MSQKHTPMKVLETFELEIRFAFMDEGWPEKPCFNYSEDSLDPNIRKVVILDCGNPDDGERIPGSCCEGKFRNQWENCVCGDKSEYMPYYKERLKIAQEAQK